MQYLPIKYSLTDDATSNFDHLLTSSTTRSFRVPDTDNDSSSDISQADSVAILDPHPRTFSVPSSDDEIEDEDIAQAGKAAVGKTATRAIFTPAYTNPSNAKPTNVSRFEKDLARVSIGASQANPINLDDGRREAIDLDSENDGPGIIPINHPTTNVAGKRADASIEPLEEASLGPCSPTYSTVDVDTDVSEYEDDEALFGDIEDVQDRDISLVAKGKARAFDCPAPSLAGSIDRSPSPAVENRDVGYAPTFDKEGHSEYGEESTNVPRPSSPSDAALAKKFVASLEAKNLYDENEESPQPFVNRFPDPESTIPRPYTIVPSGMDQLKNTREQQAGPRSPRASHKDIGGDKPERFSQSSSLYHLAPIFPGKPEYYPTRRNAVAPQLNTDDFMAKEDTFNSYATGPFSALPYPGTPSEYVFPETYGGYKGQMWPEHLRSNERYQSGPVASDIHFPSTRPNYNDNWKRPHNVTTTFEPYIPPSLPELSQIHGSCVQKAPLPNLMNIAPEPMPTTRGCKRKADDMESENEESVQTPNLAGALPNPGETQDFTVLQHAQPREDQAMPIETAMTQELAISQEAAQPALEQTPATLENAVPRNDGPARKKVKTSLSKAAGVGKFVSGIAVGVVGVLATFIATIPASVREEALREISSVQ